MQRLSLSLAKRAGGVDDCFCNSLAINYDFLDQARRVEGFDELKRCTWNGLFPAGTTREVDFVAADRWANNAARWLDSRPIYGIFKTTAIGLRDD